MDLTPVLASAARSAVLKPQDILSWAWRGLRADDPGEPEPVRRTGPSPFIAGRRWWFDVADDREAARAVGAKSVGFARYAAQPWDESDHVAPEGHIRRVDLPSGKTIEVVYFDDGDADDPPDEVAPAEADPRPPLGEVLVGLPIRFSGSGEEMVRWFASHPTDLLQMHWRDFEVLVAELLAQNGFAVTLTPGSRDRGVDLYVVKNVGLVPRLYVVECKRYGPGRLVGPDLVRQLRGVVDREGATGGILATTSFFTGAAHAERDTIPYRLSLKDYDDVVGWLRGETIT